MALVLCLTLLTGCFRVRQDPESGRGLQRDLAKEAVPLSDSTSSSTAELVTPSPPTSSPVDSVGLRSPGGSKNLTSVVARPVGTTMDPSGDIGTDGKGYGDATSLSIEEVGSKARITLRMASAIPNPLPSQEVMGIGVDFFSSEDSFDSDYQLFADGSDEGWFGYLQAPTGLVEFQGTLSIGGNRLVFEIPWSELGDMRGSRFSCFVDWAGRGLVDVLSEATEDHVPDSGRAPFSR